MAEKAKAAETAAAKAEPAKVDEHAGGHDYHIRPDELFGGSADEGLTAEELFGKKGGDVTDDVMNGILGDDPSKVLIHQVQPDGTVSTSTNAELRDAIKAGRREKEPGANLADAGGGAEGRAAESETKPEGRAAEKDTAADESKGGEEAGSTRAETLEQRSTRERAAAAEARSAAMARAALPSDTPTPKDVDFSSMPNRSDFDTDEEADKAQQEWIRGQVQARDTAAAQQRIDDEAKRQEAAKAAAATAVSAQRQESWGEAVLARHPDEAERAKLKAAQAQVYNRRASKEILDKNPKPMTHHFLSYRDWLQHNGGIDAGVRPASELCADLYGDPAATDALENLSASPEVYKALAAVDNPLPLVEHLASEAGAGDRSVLERVAQTGRGDLIAARVHAMARSKVPAASQSDTGPEVSGAAAPASPSGGGGAASGAAGPVEKYVNEDGFATNVHHLDNKFQDWADKLIYETATQAG